MLPTAEQNMTCPDQLAAAKHLLDMLHPAAPALQDALDAAVPLSAVIEAVRSGLAKNPLFPHNMQPEALGDGAIIERLGPFSFLVHERFELGQMRYSEVSSRHYFFLRGAVLRYLGHYRALLRVKRVNVKSWA